MCQVAYQIVQHEGSPGETEIIEVQLPWDEAQQHLEDDECGQERSLQDSQQSEPQEVQVAQATEPQESTEVTEVMSVGVNISQEGALFVQSVGAEVVAGEEQVEVTGEEQAQDTKNDQEYGATTAIHSINESGSSTETTPGYVVVKDISRSPSSYEPVSLLRQDLGLKPNTHIRIQGHSVTGVEGSVQVPVQPQTQFAVPVHVTPPLQMPVQMNAQQVSVQIPRHMVQLPAQNQQVPVQHIQIKDITNMQQPTSHNTPSLVNSLVVFQNETTQEVVIEQSQVGEQTHLDQNSLQDQHLLEQVVTHSKNIVEEESQDFETETQTISQTVELGNVEDGSNSEFPPLISSDYIKTPDFSSQDYYNWLSSFVEYCKMLDLPLAKEVFENISNVHKTVSDVLAAPVGILSNKNNFRILNSMSKDLYNIINDHLMQVMEGLDDE